MEDLTFARLGSHQVPEMAHLRLPDAVNTPEALLKAVGVPGQIVVDHQVRALQIDTLASRIGRQQDLYLFILREGLLRLRRSSRLMPP